MDTNKLAAFLCVAKHKNYTKAAEELFISQPALSRKMSEFEKEMGVQLLVRDNRHVELTRAGEILSKETPSLLKLLDDVTKKIRNVTDNPDNHIIIGCSGIEYSRFDRIFDAFKEKYPDITYTLTYNSGSEEVYKLEHNLIDIGFQMHMEAKKEEFANYAYFDTDILSIVLPKNHPMAGATKLKLMDLIGDTVYLMKEREGEHVAYKDMINKFEQIGFIPKGGIIIVNTVDSLVLNVGAGLGIGLLNSQIRRKYSEFVTFVPMVDPIWNVNIDVVWNKNNDNTAAKLFVEFIEEINCKENRSISLN